MGVSSEANLCLLLKGYPYEPWVFVVEEVVGSR